MSFSVPKYEDSALFIGIVKSQTDKNIRNFFINEFKNEKGLFNRYKEGLIEHSASSGEDRTKERELLKGFYDPQGYILLGDADLAVISQVDDFMFGGHLFHPTHPFKAEHEDEKFYYDYQTITGYTPKFSLNDEETLNDKWLSVYNHEQKQFPFIGITRIKLNSSLTVGVGKKVNSLINHLIKKIITQKTVKSIKIDFFLIESFCSYEFTLITLSNSIKAITDLILSLREHSLRSLMDLIVTEDSDSAVLKKIVNEIELNSLMSIWINNPDINSVSKANARSKQLYSEIKKLNILDSHLFTKTQTTFGYHIDYYECQHHFYDIEDIDEVEFSISFSVKPGHLNAFKKRISEFNEFTSRYKDGTIPSGNSVLNYIFIPDTLHPIPSFQSFYPIPNKNSDLIFDPDGNVLSNLNKIRTSFSIKTKTDDQLGIDIIEIEKDTKKHLKVTEKLKELTFGRKELEDIRTWLKKIGVSKVLQTRIQKMYGNYNDHIQDSILHTYFVDLLPYLKWIYNVLHDFSNESFNKFSSSDIHITLNKLINNFEHAYKNKHHQTYLEQNATDNNLEYAGGLHQIISGYEAFFRVVQSGMNFDIEKNAIAYVSGEPDVDSDAYAVRLNYYHLYNVQHFMGIILKEASNFYNPSNYTLRTKRKIQLNVDGKKSLSYLKMDENSYSKIKVIRNKLSNLTQFSYSDNTNQLLTFLNDNLNNSLFQYILSDFVTFYYAAESKFDPFVYWHFSLFLQNPTHYTSDRSIAEKNLWHTLLRLNIIRLIANEKNKDTIIPNYLLSLNIGTSPDAFIDDNLKIFKFCNSLFEVSEFKEWIDNIQKELIHFFINEKNPSAKKLDPVFQMFLEQGQDSNKAIYNAYEYLNTQSSLGLKGKINKYKKEFKENLANSFYTEYKDDYSAFVLAIINFVLVELKRINDNSIQILFRNNKGIPNPQTSSEIIVKFANDPFGGIFIRSHKNRIEFFKFRREVLNTMIDFSLKIKVELYKTRIELYKNKTKRDPDGGDLF